MQHHDILARKRLLTGQALHLGLHIVLSKQVRIQLVLGVVGAAAELTGATCRCWRQVVVLYVLVKVLQKVELLVA